MAKLTVPSIKKLRLKGWPLVLAVGLLLALIAIIDRGGLGDTSTAAATGCELRVTTSSPLNVRSSASDQGAVTGTLGPGDTVEGTSVVTGGYRQIAGGSWVADQFVTPTAGSTCS